jgi:hypothetical protein
LALSIIVVGAIFIGLKVMLLQRAPPVDPAALSEEASSVPLPGDEQEKASAVLESEGSVDGSVDATAEARGGPDVEPATRRPPEPEPSPEARLEPVRPRPGARDPQPVVESEATLGPDRSPGSVTLTLTHRPVTVGDAGASDLVLARLEGPRDTRVVLHSGPAGGPYRQTTMRARGSGRWESWLEFEVPAGSRIEYWISASHPAADVEAGAGSRSSPFVVEIR